MNIVHGDNLEVLKQLKGERFDFAELDGPYMAGLEDWDNLSLAEYLQHYAARLNILRNLMHPWGVVFIFGYPEGCAEIKVMAEATGWTCRRWLTWYKPITAHKGRKVETILVLMPYYKPVENFHEIIRSKRERLGLSRKDMAQRMGVTNGRLFKGVYEQFSGAHRPNLDHFMMLSKALQLNVAPFWGNIDFSFEGLTDIDYIERTYIEPTQDLNDNGLRSKPVGLYVDLFRPLRQPINSRKALVLYGGSGNAAIAAEALGYDVKVIEQDAARCELIELRAPSLVQTWKERLSQGVLFSPNAAASLDMFSQVQP